MGRLKAYCLKTLKKLSSYPLGKTPSTPSVPELTVEFRVLNPTFWIHLCTMSDLGFAEAYMYGDTECNDLAVLFKASSPRFFCFLKLTVFQLFMYSNDSIGGLNSTTSHLLGTLSRLTTSYQFLNTVTNSRSNISAHYNISNTMFKGSRIPYQIF